MGTLRIKGSRYTRQLASQSVWPAEDRRSRRKLTLLSSHTAICFVQHYEVPRLHLLNRHLEPDWVSVHCELKRKHVTLAMLLEEHIQSHPEGYRYSHCELYRSWEAKLSVTMRQTHLGGDRLFIDYAVDTVPVDRRPYVEAAAWTQTLGDWISAHARAFRAIGGVPRLIVPDNAKVAVIRACLYEPQINRTYAEMAAHYRMAVLPTRPCRLRDKDKVEVAVLVVDRWILARLRNRPVFTASVS